MKTRSKHILFSTFIPNTFMRVVPDFPNYIVDIFGNVFSFKLNRYIKQFNSNGYKQVVLNNGSRRCLGVHQVVAMSFLDECYSDDVVHHLDENKQNNFLGNLSIMRLEDHAKQHADSSRLTNYIKEHGPANKGKKMSKEFCEHCKQSALKRAKFEKINHVYRGNQFRNADGSKKQIDPEKFEKFREACRKSALKRHSKHK